MCHPPSAAVPPWRVRRADPRTASAGPPAVSPPAVSPPTVPPPAVSPPARRPPRLALVAGLLALGGLASACDAPPPTGPAADGSRTAAPAARPTDALPSSADVVITRSALLPAGPGNAARRLTRTWDAAPRAGPRTGGSPRPADVRAAVARANARAGGGPGGRDSLLALIGRAAVPVVRLPAPAASATCVDRPGWARRVAGGAPGTRLTLAGAHDAPPSQVTIEGAQGVVATIRFTWVRRPTSWELTRQETSTPEHGVVDVVTVERRQGGRLLAVEPVPATVCTGTGAPGRPHAGLPPTAASLAPADPPGFGGTGVPSPASRGLFDAQPASVDVCTALLASDPCAEARRQVASDMAEYAAVAAAGYVACFWTPPPLTVATCTAAWTAIAARTVVLRNAVAALRDCEGAAHQQKRIACGCAATSRGVPSGPLFARTGAARTPAPAAPARSGGEFCDAPPPPPDGGVPADFFTYPIASAGGGGGEGGGGGVRVCVYTDYYDGDGNYLYTVSRGCIVVAA